MSITLPSKKDFESMTAEQVRKLQHDCWDKNAEYGKEKDKKTQEIADLIKKFVSDAEKFISEHEALKNELEKISKDHKENNEIIRFSTGKLPDISSDYDKLGAILKSLHKIEKFVEIPVKPEKPKKTEENSLEDSEDSKKSETKPVKSKKTEVPKKNEVPKKTEVPKKNEVPKKTEGSKDFDFSKIECKYGAKCKSFTDGTVCKYSHSKLGDSNGSDKKKRIVPKANRVDESDEGEN